MHNLPESINILFKHDRLGSERYHGFARCIRVLATKYNFDINNAVFRIAPGKIAIDMLRGNSNIAVIGLSEATNTPDCVLIGNDEDTRFARCEGLFCTAIGLSSTIVEQMNDRDVIVVITDPVDIADQKFVKETRRDNRSPKPVSRMIVSPYYNNSNYDKSGYKSTLYDRYVVKVIAKRRQVVSKFVESVSDRINQIIASEMIDSNVFDRDTSSKLRIIEYAIEQVKNIIGIDGYRLEVEPNDNIKGLFATDKTIIEVVRRIDSKQLTEQLCIDTFKSAAKF